MDHAIIIASFVLVQTVMVAVINGMFSREKKHRQKINESVDRRASLRAEESMLAMRMMSANTSLTIATALALQEGRTNGKMTTALVEAERAQLDYYEFINRIAAQKIGAD